MAIDAGALTAAVAAVCPIDGLALSGADAPWPTVKAADGSLWRIDCRPEASAQQRQAAQGVVAAWSPPAAAATATPYQIALALNLQGAAAAAAFDGAITKAKPSDRNRWNARTEAIPADNPVYVRLCGIAGLDPAPLHALAMRQ